MQMMGIFEFLIRPIISYRRGQRSASRKHNASIHLLSFSVPTEASSKCENLVFYLDSSAVLITGHAINLIHDQDVLTAHSLRRAYKTHTNSYIQYTT